MRRRCSARMAGHARQDESPRRSPPRQPRLTETDRGNRGPLWSVFLEVESPERKCEWAPYVCGFAGDMGLNWVRDAGVIEAFESFLLAFSFRLCWVRFQPHSDSAR